MNLTPNRHHQLTLNHCTLTYWLESEDSVWITRLVTAKAHRGRRYAHEVLAAFLKQTDEHKLTTHVWAVPLDADTQADRLVAVYERRGFERTGRVVKGDVELVRLPLLRLPQLLARTPQSGP